MPVLKTLLPALTGLALLLAPARLRAQQPANDNCANASVIAISGGGFDYGVFTSATTDLSNATGETGEFFYFAPGHVKSVWYEFTLPTRRSLKVEILGSNLTNTAVTLYRPAACLPAKDSLLGTLVGDAGGNIENVCSNYGAYRIQVTAPAGLSASVYIKITLSCPSDAANSKYDCPPDAYAFNSGNPLPQNGSSSSGSHNIGCQSIDYAAENDCLPLPDKADYTQSTWYVFKTGARVDLLSFNCYMGFTGTRLGYRIYQGDVRPAGPAGLTQIDCGLAKEDGYNRYIEFPCTLLPNTLYSIELLFHKNFTYSNFSLTARQRGETPTGWPKPVQPPVLAANQLGVLPNGGPTAWKDRFDCGARISLNPCPPANPVSGTVTIGAGSNARAFDLATWATFTLTSDANVDFDYTSSNYFLTRIFRKTLGNSCPSPDPATDLAYEFYGRNGAKGCLPAGDYAVQVLAGIAYSYPNANGFWDKWSNGYLGTSFELRFTVDYLPANGLFMLDAPGAFDPVNAFNPLQDGVIYPATPAIFICKNTVLPANGLCTGAAKALYREVRIDQDGLLCMANLRTDDYPDAPLRYQFYQADANASANAQNAHNAGETIAGMTDYLGFCIDKDDNTFNPAGLDTFCTCATAGVYTLVSLGDSANVGKGDAPKFRHRILKTVHDSRANAETVNVGASIPGTYTSQPDVFSCADNLGVMPPCGNRKKLIFRQFYLQAPALVTILETGASTPYFSLFKGQATDPASILTLVGAGCGAAFSSPDSCAPLPPGWYTVVSYGSGPNYTDKHSWDNLGHAVDVGKTDQIAIRLDPARTPKFNRPHKAWQAGVTDWTPLPPANPNAVTGKLYPLPTEYFCNPDTPFIADSILPCAAGYNRIAFYVFSITKPSFVQIRDVDTSFYVEVFPFDVAATPGALLSVSPVYQCLSAGKDYRQICDLPPGKYTIAIFAKDKHKGATVTPALYIEAVGTSRFDDASDAYDFDLIPPGGVWRNGKTGDVNLSYPSEAPSRDVFYCTTGARNTDPADTRCGAQLNPLIYAINGPKPLFLPGNPPPPVSQPWRTLWYTFVLEGSGTASITVNPLTPGSPRPLIAVYESPLDATQPWSSLKNLGDAALSAGLTLLDENVSYFCDADYAFNNIDLSFPKNGCVKNRVRYFLVVSFDADEPNFPNQAIAISIKYDDVPTHPALYDERTTANVLNGLSQTQPPYTAVPLAPGNVFAGPEFSLQCYTKNATDPPGACSNGGESAWFKFEVLTTGQFYVALQKVGVAGWFDNTLDMSVWQETTPGGALLQLPLSYEYVVSDQHEWMSGCIGPGTYYLLVRSCSSIDELQPYKAVIKLTDSPGDFCSNAIPLDVTNATPVTATATVDCHTIGTDFGETSPDGMGCLFGPAGKKTTWFRVHVTAGPKVDLNFKFAENLNGSTVTLNHLAYRVFSGSCGALTPVVCSAVGSNVITQNCLGPGDYFVQVALPVKVGSTAVEGTISLSVTATPNTDPNCTPTNPNAPQAGFDIAADCQTITFVNTSTAGADIAYLWQFPGGATSTLAAPVWTPPGPGAYAVTLTVTNTANNLTATLTKSVSVNAPFAAYQPLADALSCNGASVTLDATLPGATYLWSDNSTAPTLTVSQAGTFWVLIQKDGCEKRDTAMVAAVDAHGTLNATLCPGDTLNVGNQLFYAGQASGTVTLPAAHPLGCDSILSVALSFYPPASQNLDTTLCAGLTFSIGGQTFSAANPSGQVTLPNQAPHGCDLALNVNATFTPPPDFSIEQTLCKGETFTYHGEIFSETHPSATVILPAAVPGGCDTAVAVSMAYYYPDTALVAVQRCANQTFTFGDSTFTPQHPGGWVTLPGATTQYGCDSVVRVEVAFLPTVVATEQPVLCTGRSIVIHGQTFSQANPAGVILVPGEGGDCDTVLTVSLHFLPNVLAVRHPQICTGRTITLYGQTFSEANPSGVIQVPGLNGDCDTVLNVSVTFLPNVQAALQPTVCAGKSITIYGQTFSEANPTGVIHIPGQGNDCDTLLSVTPHFLPKNEVWLTPNLCPGESVTIGNKVFNANKLADTVMLLAYNGCDSIIHVDANQLLPATGSISGTYCHGDTVLLFGQAFTAFNPSGVIVRPGAAPYGCDSIWTVNLAFKPFKSSAAQQSACLGVVLPLQAPPGGTAYRWQDGSSQPVFNAVQNGVYWVQTLDADGCVVAQDSFAVQFAPLPVPLAGDADACAGDPPSLTASGSTGAFQWYDAATGGNLLFAGAAFNPGALNADTLFWVEAVQSAVPGCVSARVPVAVHVYPHVTTQLSAAICETETYAFGNQTLAQAGTYQQALHTVHGCDSTVVLTLTVLDTFFQKTSVVICPGASYQLPSGQVVNQGGVYAGQWAAQSGCDSSWQVIVDQKQLLVRTDPAVLCAGRSLALPWGDSVSAPGSYVRVFADADGCDSLRWTVNVQAAVPIQPGLTVFTDFNGFAVSCADAADGRAGLSPKGGAPPYGLLWNTGGGSALLSGLPAGAYSATVTDAAGCTAAASIALDAPPVLTLAVETTDPLCPGEARGVLSAAASGGVSPYLYALGSGVLSAKAVYQGLAPGAYHLLVQDANGCAADATAEIGAPAGFSVYFDPATLQLHFGDSLQLEPVLDFTPDSIAWSPESAGLSCLHCLQPWISPLRSTDYQLRVWTAAGCPATATLRVLVDRKPRLYVPTAFSPNGDGENDFFEVFAGPEVRVIRRLSVYDRWGETAFEARDFAPNGANGRWAGRLRGQDLNPGVFVWLCVYELADGTVETESGDVTLVR